jgi:hypothetical protein
MSEAFQDSKEAIVDCVFRFIDRMNDVCEQDPADRILQEFTKSMDPLIGEYLELKFAPQHVRLQQSFEFRTPDQIEADEKLRDQMRRPRRKRS